jgi:hypothetical protein
MMKFPTEWKVIKAMFQTTNQLWLFIPPFFWGKNLNFLWPDRCLGVAA